MSGNPTSQAPQLGVYSLVDLRADPLDQAFCDRAVIVAAKFVMRCRAAAAMSFRVAWSTALRYISNIGTV